MRRLLAFLGGTAVVVSALVLVYLAATIAGALVAGQTQVASTSGDRERIYLLTNLLHADIAIPVDESLREKYRRFEQDGVPISNPRLKYLVFGWGSRAFYTTVPTLADITPAVTFTAITGDSSVMRVAPAGEIAVNTNAYPLDLPPGGTARLLEFIDASFAGKKGEPSVIPDKKLAVGDAFYLANGGFHIFRPCNIWAADALRAAGLDTGRWTPTTQSLLLGLRIHSPQAVRDPLWQ